jgi:hypothetical protein
MRGQGLHILQHANAPSGLKCEFEATRCARTCGFWGRGVGGGALVANGECRPAACARLASVRARPRHALAAAPLHTAHTGARDAVCRAALRLGALVAPRTRPVAGVCLIQACTGPAGGRHCEGRTVAQGRRGVVARAGCIAGAAARRTRGAGEGGGGASERSGCGIAGVGAGARRGVPVARTLIEALQHLVALNHTRLFQRTHSCFVLRDEMNAPGMSE